MRLYAFPTLYGQTTPLTERLLSEFLHKPQKHIGRLDKRDLLAGAKISVLRKRDRVPAPLEVLPAFGSELISTFARNISMAVLDSKVNGDSTASRVQRPVLRHSSSSSSIMKPLRIIARRLLPLMLFHQPGQRLLHIGRQRCVPSEPVGRMTFP